MGNVSEVLIEFTIPLRKVSDFEQKIKVKPCNLRGFL